MTRSQGFKSYPKHVIAVFACRFNICCSSSSSGPGAYAPDAPQPTGLLYETFVVTAHMTISVMSLGVLY